MKSFSEYMAGKPPEPPKQKAWKASKDEFMRMWNSLEPSNIPMRAISDTHKGTRFRSDGLRLTGSPQFINSVLARLKDLLSYDQAPGTKLDIRYEEIERRPDYEGQSYVCYVYVEQKGLGKK